MSPTIAAASKTPAAATLVVSGVFADGLDDAGVDSAVLETLGFAGKVGQRQLLTGSSPMVALVGLGDRDDCTTAVVRGAASAVAKLGAKHKAVATTLAADVADAVGAVEAATAVAEGVVLGAYAFDQYKSEAKRPTLKKVSVVGSTAKRVSAALAEGSAVAEAVCVARDFVNEPGGTLTPALFARRTAALARKHGLKSKVMDEAAIKKAKLGGVLGVNRGSTNPPRFVELTYEPAGKPTGTLALVGKGITFDAGGLSIKTGTGMMTMKCDMGGGAAVIGAMVAIAAVAPACRVRAYVPMTDNMLGGDATRPGDVLTIRNGKTIEVLNTDAEGRLILADALSLASEAKPDAIIDLATLTGACMVALGPKIAGLMGNNDDFIAQVEAASDSSGERVWHLPLPADYRKMCDSPIADMKNIGGPYGGSLTAGLILQEFVADGIPWAHLDIAGPAFTDAAEAEVPKGGTGFGVRLLVELARSFSKPSA